MAGPRRRRAGRRWLRSVVATLAVTALLWLGGLVWFAGRLPAPDPGRRSGAEAIVVLTGGSERLREGLRLLAEGRAPRLLVSGVYPHADLDAILRSAGLPAESLECCVTLGYAAGDTAGNARETAAWMAERGYRSLLLVTASYHMPRSLLEFRRAMPDLEIVAHPVFPEGFRHADWWLWPGSAALVASEFNKYLAVLARMVLGGGPRG